MFYEDGYGDADNEAIKTHFITEKWSDFQMFDFFLSIEIVNTQFNYPRLGVAFHLVSFPLLNYFNSRNDRSVV